MFVCVWVAEGITGPDSRRSEGGRSILKLVRVVSRERGVIKSEETDELRWVRRTGSRR